MQPTTTLPPIDPAETIHAILERHPETAAVFERHGIHVCCGGDVPLAVAAERAGADLARLVDDLREAAGEGGGASDS